MYQKTENSKKILNTTRETIRSFLKIYDEIENEDEEAKEDLLRAVILFACSGIDAIMKKLIEDTLEEVIKNDEGAQLKFKSYIEKRIKNKADTYDSKLLSEIFFSDKKPRDTLIEVLKKELTANSLQSAEELSRVASYFNIDTRNIEEIRNVFIIRNQITHEMDIDMSLEGIKRRKRDKNEIVDYSNKVLKMAEHYINEVENKLRS